MQDLDQPRCDAKHSAFGFLLNDLKGHEDTGDKSPGGCRANEAGVGVIASSETLQSIAREPSGNN